jgi:hypothetical protein
LYNKVVWFAGRKVREIEALTKVGLKVLVNQIGFLHFLRTGIHKYFVISKETCCANYSKNTSINISSSFWYASQQVYSLAM